MDVSNRTVEAFETVMDGTGQSLSADIAPGAHVNDDKDLLTQLLANLVENATRHCPSGTKVTLR